MGGVAGAGATLKSKDGQAAEYDAMFNVPIVQQIGHAEIHKGGHFEVHAETGGTVAATIAIAFKTPPGTKIAHMVVDWKTTGPAVLNFLEGATWDPGSGTRVVAIDNNRVTAKTSSLLEDSTGAFVAGGIQVDPTTIAGGLELHSPAGDFSYTPKQAGGDTSLARHEWPLEANQTYVIMVTKLTGVDLDYGIVLHWYEHTTRVL